MVAELLDETIDDGEMICISWLKDLLAEGHVSSSRKPQGPLPFILVTGLETEEIVEESSAISLVSVHTLTHKSEGDGASYALADQMHRRMLLLARELEDVELPNGRIATIDFVSVFKHPRREEYGDELILRRIGRYRIGLSYAQVQ